MLLPPAMRDQDPQPSQPFGERKPRPEEIEAQKRAELNKAPAVGKSTNLPTPPQHINDHEMIRRDILPPSSGLDEYVTALLAMRSHLERRNEQLIFDVDECKRVARARLRNQP